MMRKIDGTWTRTAGGEAAYQAALSRITISRCYDGYGWECIERRADGYILAISAGGLSHYAATQMRLTMADNVMQQRLAAA